MRVLVWRRCERHARLIEGTRPAGKAEQEHVMSIWIQIPYFALILAAIVWLWKKAG